MFDSEEPKQIVADLLHCETLRLIVDLKGAFQTLGCDIGDVGGSRAFCFYPGNSDQVHCGTYFCLFWHITQNTSVRTSDQ